MLKVWGLLLKGLWETLGTSSISLLENLPVSEKVREPTNKKAVVPKLKS